MGVQRIRHRIRSPQWGNILVRYNIYAVDSAEINGLHYAADSERLAMFRHNDILIWPIPETPKVAERFIPEVREELLGIYEDIKNLEAWGVGYEAPREYFRPREGEVFKTAAEMAAVWERENA